MVSGEIDAHNVLPFCIIAGVFTALLTILGLVSTKFSFLPSWVGFAIGLYVHLAFPSAFFFLNIHLQISYTQLDTSTCCWQFGTLGVASEVASWQTQLHGDRYNTYPFVAVLFQ